MEEEESVKFLWKPSDNDEQTVKSVELILIQAGSVNNDVFEDYLDGTTLKDDSALEVYQLDLCDSGNFEKSIKLPPLTTYQFLFRITDDDDKCKIDVSESHFQTILATGRTVNYVESETRVPNEQARDAFADISEASPLMNQEPKPKRTRPKGDGCGCGPDKCCVL